MSHQPDAIPELMQDSNFPTTLWPLVQAAQADDAEQAKDALDTLCRRYWKPMYCAVRRHGYKPDLAQDLVSQFIAQRFLHRSFLNQFDPERQSRFRAWLRASLTNFCRSYVRAENAIQRGGGVNIFSPEDWASVESRYQSASSDGKTADEVFDQQWAIEIYESAFAELEKKYEEQGTTQELSGIITYLTGNNKDKAEVRDTLGLEPRAIQRKAQVFRETFRSMLRDRIAETVTSPEDVEQEFAELKLLLFGKSVSHFV